MGIEIERKFLVDGDAWRSEVERSVPMAQGYLVDAAAIDHGYARSSVRVRVAGAKAWINIKSVALGIERQEFEYLIPLPDARQMMATLCHGVVEKTRHVVSIGERRFEVDVFEGANAGLVVAEVELPSADASVPRPGWLGREVSGLARYYNVNLIDHPYSRWTQRERRAEDAAC